MGKSNEDEAIDVDGPRNQLISAAVEIARSSAPAARYSFTKQRRAQFIEVLASGATVSEAAKAVGVGIRHVYHLRKTDEKFGEAWALAVIAGTDPLLGRAAAIGLYGDPGSMATVQAIKLVLQANHPAFRDARAAGVSISRTHPDGTKDVIQASANGIPD